jgi:predicted nucleotidyltransferase
MKITPEIIEEVKNRLIKTYNPLEIYLFGSYAWGTPTDESDLDLLIVVEHSDLKRHQRSYAASDALFDMMIPKDVIVYTKEEFNKRSTDITTLCYKIKNEGKILYARA